MQSVNLSVNYENYERMNVIEYARRLNDHILGRIVILLTGLFVMYWVLRQYPPIRPVIWWAFPVLLLLWGGSRLYFYGVNKPLTVIAGCLLILGGITRALFQMVPMNEMTGAIANIIPFMGIIAEMYAQYYRKDTE